MMLYLLNREKIEKYKEKSVTHFIDLGLFIRISFVLRLSNADIEPPLDL